LKAQLSLGIVCLLSKWTMSRLSNPACLCRSADTHAAISDTFYRDTCDMLYFSFSRMPSQFSCNLSRKQCIQPAVNQKYLSTSRLQVDNVGSTHRRIMLWIPCCVALADFQLYSAYLSAVRNWFSFYFGAEREIRARQIKYGTGSAHLGGNVALNRDENMDL